MKLEVVGWRVLVKPEKVEEKTKSGLYIPETVQNQEQLATTKGEVVDIGPTAFGTEHDIVNLKKGDIVHFAKYSGSMVKVEEEELRIINDEDVIAVERGKKNG